MGWDSDDISDTDGDSDTINYFDTDTESLQDNDTDTESPPTDDDIETWKFAVMGDSRDAIFGVNVQVLSKLVQAVIEQDVELVIFTGDAVFGSYFVAAQLPSWLKVMEPLWDAGIKVYPGRGNHETQGINLNALAAWQNSFVKKRALPTNGPTGHKKVTYSVLHRNALFISLDNYAGKTKVPQDWLDIQLAQMEVPHLFVYAHEPAFKLDHEDCLDDFPAKRDEFWQSLREAGGRTYFCGHDHFYDHARVDDGDGNPDNDLHQFVVGTAGAPLYGWSPPYNGVNNGMTIEQVSHVQGFGYVLGEVTGLDVTLTYISMKGEIKDSWSYTVDGF